MNLTEEEVRQVETLIQSSGWRVFIRYVKERQALASEFFTPDDICSFLTREQQFGKLEELRSVIPEFVENLKREKQKYE